MRGTKAKQLMKIIRAGVAASNKKNTDDVENKFWYKMVTKVVKGESVQAMGSWFRHPESIRSQYQRAKALYRKGLIKV